MAENGWRDVAFQYDGTFDGFLCCVFESYTHKEFPVAFCSGEECWSLYETRDVATVREHAQRVFRSVCARSPVAGNILRRAFLTCLSDKEIRLYALVKKLYEEGPSFLHNTSDAIFYPISKALRHMDGELEKLRGFVRFSEYSGVLGAQIAPKNRVLPLLKYHFCERYANESFFIHDTVHKEVLLYSANRHRIVPLDSLLLSLPNEEEIQFRVLWKRFYDTIAISERANPRCQNTFLPKRYRGMMTEFLPVDYEKSQASDSLPRNTNIADEGKRLSGVRTHDAENTANLPDIGAAWQGFCAPNATPAPETRTISAPSVPASNT